MQAATTVQWLDLPNKIGHGKMQPDGREDRQYRVVTKDGKTHIGYKLIFSHTDVALADGGPAVPREQVKEIRIRRNLSFWDALFAPAAGLGDSLSGGGGEGWFPDPVEVILLLPVAIAVTAAASPVTLPIFAVKRLLPDKVFEVVP